MHYQLLLADADGTLFDFHLGERFAISHVFECFGIAVTEEHMSLYHQINDGHWKRLERGETTQERLRVERFADFLAQIHIKADAQAMSRCFMEKLGQQRFLLPGAKAFCEQISAVMPIVLVTNGIAQVQRGRFTNCELSPYLSGMVISEEIGHPKPHPAMVEKAMELQGVTDKRAVVLLGDSITADIAAANNAGVDSILFTNGAAVQAGHGATYAAQTFEAAAGYVLR
ncbi:MAG: HAD-IA family hydrolase [Clostridia bacterium]